MIYVERFIHSCYYYVITGDTGMIASGSTFSPYLGRVIRDLLHAVCCKLFGMVRKHKSIPIIQGELQPPRA